MSENDEPTGKHLHVVIRTPNQEKHRAGTDDKQPSNDDYDYRADLGKSGGGDEHNPILDTQSMETISKRPKAKTGK